MVEAPDIATFAALNKKLTDAVKSRDFATLGAMFADDAVMLPPGGNIIAGKSNISSFWEQRAARLQDMEFDGVTINTLGSDVVRAMGTFTLRMEGGQALLGDPAAPRETSCKYLAVWRMIDGEWKLETMAWNRIGAPPGRGWRLGRYTAGGGAGPGMGAGLGFGDELGLDEAAGFGGGPGFGQRSGPGQRGQRGGRRGPNPGRPPGFPTR